MVKVILGIILGGVGICYLISGLHSQLPVRAEPRLVWQVYSPEAVIQSIKEHKPVVIDFYADWCVSCHVLEREVFSKPQIMHELAKFTTLRVNATNMDDPKVSSIIEQYHVIGLPTVIFIDRHGQELKNGRVIGVSAIKEFWFIRTKGEGFAVSH